MIRRQLGLASLLGLAACAVRPQATEDACRMLLAGEVAGESGLQDCLDWLPPGATLALPPSRFVLAHPLVVRRRVTLTTAGAGSARCAEDGAGCAVLAVRPAAPGWMHPAITLAAAGSVLDHVVVLGSKDATPFDPVAACNGPGRPGMGAIAVTAAAVAITHSVVRDVACYSAIVVAAGADGFRLEDDAVLANGTHDQPGMWADGLTLIDGVDAVVRGDLFRDNTDVQLVLGGCLRCTIADNRLEETAAPGAGAFAGLLVHGWPHTSGDYAGSSITGNTIDCGPERRCGFGLGIGGRAWYPAATSGGLVAGNSVTRALVGINVDDATGTVGMRDNRVAQSGGIAISHCGTWPVGAVNITPASRPFVGPTAGVAMAAEAVTARSFAGCIPGT